MATAMQDGKAVYISERRLYLAADGTVVEANDPRRASLLVGAECPMPLELAIRYGLVVVESSVRELHYRDAAVASSPQHDERADAGEGNATAANVYGNDELPIGRSRTARMRRRRKEARARAEQLRGGPG